MPQSPPAADCVEEVVRRALAEDRAHADATSQAVVSAEVRAHGQIVAKAAGVLAGVAYAAEAFAQACPDGHFDWRAADGQPVRPGDEVLRCHGSARGLLAAERVALNFLQQLSGVATLTARAVAAAGGAFAVFDTRKTVPGLRDAQKAAVVAGGGCNHRRDLDDQILLKENHFALSGLEYGETVARAVQAAAGRPVGAEATDLDEARAALRHGADYVLLDNFAPGVLREAVAALRAEHPDAVLEVSGGLSPDGLPALRDAGIDRVSLGALTHSAPALDLSFLFGDPVPGDA